MTVPRNPGEIDPADSGAASAPRRGRHAAPDDDIAEVASTDAVGSEPPTSHSAPDAERAAHSAPEPLDPAPGAPHLEGAPHSAPGPVAPEPSAAAESVDEPARDAAGATAATDAGPRRRHAAEGSQLRIPGWMIAIAAVVVVGLLAWLVIGLISGEDDDSAASPSSTPSASTSAAPTSVDAASLPQVLCMGSSYVMVDSGKTTEQLLADPKGAEAQFPGSKLSTIPPGCVAGSDVRDEVVLALGPYTSIEEACAAGKSLQGATFRAFAGSADTGLTETSCP